MYSVSLSETVVQITAVLSIHWLPCVWQMVD